MSQPFNVHFTFRGKSVPFQLMLALIVMIVVGALYPKSIGFGAQITFALVCMATIAIWKRYLSIVLGKPAFRIDASGFYVETNKTKIAWSEIISVRLYRQPELLVVEHPFPSQWRILHKLPRSLVLQNQRWLITPNRIKQPLIAVVAELEKYTRVERLDKASPELESALRR